MQEREQMFPSMEEASVMASLLHDAVQSWKVGWDLALRHLLKVM